MRQSLELNIRRGALTRMLTGAPLSPEEEFRELFLIEKAGAPDFMAQLTGFDPQVWPNDLCPKYQVRK